jgi:predicted PurR-regulated permease PerM
VLAWEQLSGGAVLFTVLLVAAQTALVNVLMPRVMSSELGMPPLVVFFAILVGLRLGGALGAFLGIPIMGVIYSMVQLLMRSWKASQDEQRVHQQASPDT